MSKKSMATMAVTVLVSSVYLAGCGLFSGGEKEKIDPPEDVSYLEEGESVDTKQEGDSADAKKEGESVESKKDGEKKEKPTASGEEEEATVMTELYLIDENGYVASQKLPLPKTESIATQALEYLVTNGPVQNILPNGFRAVLPADTQVSVNIKDGKAIADFSNEFAEYQPEDEKKILQAVTWTLTQFDSIETVELRMNGYELTEMPVNGTPVDEKLSRKDGINTNTTGVVDVTNTHPVTVYYVSQKGDQTYYVPVTQRVSNSVEDPAKAVIQQLVEGPGYQSTLVSDFTDVALLDDPKVKDGIVTLNFNEAIYSSFEEKIVSEHLLNSLVLSLTEQKGIKSVSVKVNGETALVNKEGEPITEPVTRPENVNTISF
ncbi:GerMN domain-containing protein [Rossellomorea sp. BNER]|uniref:GerMN domain-containing protein n=1 Tax=Rossellomorea sp. BNER TaxID=2962031 RepID=UPI003AF23499|nr:GerMN domain-containing protein [Rossellomorea sp. BNER]